MRKIIFLSAGLITFGMFLYILMVNENLRSKRELIIGHLCSHVEKYDWNDFNITGRPATDKKLVHYLRSEVIVKPNSLPYNLKDPFSVDPVSVELATLSQSIFKGKRNGVFFEAGAYHPESHSMTVFLERFFGWTGLLIEPNPNLFSVILKANRKSLLLPACISPKAEALTLQMSNAGQQSRIERDSSSGFSVDCYPIYSILVAANMTSVDYFVLDVEGFEMDILKTIPFHLVNIQVFAIEHYNHKNPEEIEIFMTGKGYSVMEKTTWDYIFTKLGSIYGTNTSFYDETKGAQNIFKVGR